MTLEEHEFRCTKRRYEDITYAGVSQYSIVGSDAGKSACTTCSIEAAFQFLHGKTPVVGETIREITRNGVLLYLHYKENTKIEHQECTEVLKTIPRYNQLEVITGKILKLTHMIEGTGFVKGPPEKKSQPPTGFDEHLKNLMDNSKDQSLCSVVTKQSETILIFFPKGRNEIYVFDSHSKDSNGAYVATLNRENMLMVSTHLQDRFPYTHFDGMNDAEMMQFNSYNMTVLKLNETKSNSGYRPICLDCKITNTKPLSDLKLKRLCTTKHLGHTYCYPTIPKPCPVCIRYPAGVDGEHVVYETPAGNRVDQTEKKKIDVEMYLKQITGLNAKLCGDVKQILENKMEVVDLINNERQKNAKRVEVLELEMDAQLKEQKAAKAKIYDSVNQILENKMDVVVRLNEERQQNAERVKVMLNDLKQQKLEMDAQLKEAAAVQNTLSMSRISDQNSGQLKLQIEELTKQLGQYKDFTANIAIPCPTYGCPKTFLWAPLMGYDYLTPFTCIACQFSYCFPCRSIAHPNAPCNKSNQQPLFPGMILKKCPNSVCPFLACIQPPLGCMACGTAVLSHLK
eukprot:TRINITY_DN1604_c0_g2_i1.p1 TRINITY_DN1604_c0_g2~~TRINITY_DN1604_c0_g2_i1.p1  ORF type:complete len:606 (-),score=54.38 TRINITY_DN1604_c0_g2_i1:88-1794(-)